MTASGCQRTSTPPKSKTTLRTGDAFTGYCSSCPFSYGSMPNVARSRIRRWRIFFIFSALFVIVLAAIAALWIAHLDRVVTREFQGRLWSIPARVYAAPLELYVGAPVTANELEQELHGLHYRRGDPSAGPGIYQRIGNAFDIHTRRVPFFH